MGKQLVEHAAADVAHSGPSTHDDHIHELATDNRGGCSKAKWKSGLFFNLTHTQRQRGTNLPSPKGQQNIQMPAGTSARLSYLILRCVRGCQGGTSRAKSVKELQKAIL